MPIYDTTFIINPQTDDSSIDHEVRAVGDLITNNGGKILREERLGTRRLAYPINRLTQGYYACYVYEAPPSLPKLLDRHFRLGEAYLRHLTIRFEGEIEPPEETTAGTERAAQAPESDTAKKEPAVPEQPAPVAAPDAEKPPVKAEPQPADEAAGTEPPVTPTAGEPVVSDEEEEL